MHHMGDLFGRELTKLRAKFGEIGRVKTAVDPKNSSRVQILLVEDHLFSVRKNEFIRSFRFETFKFVPALEYERRQRMLTTRANKIGMVSIKTGN